ncbi:TetR family transcriptional regulator C-terminal domain-containing protein, partial [Aneurinibacillus tyrosinisolvens]|uniref:TetR family transcriptional regulator C-terminal domain-containing protein n=1 Tax=Aneurinibacillus tyrosinisolvens TaxID=1443435 RepID=UPI00063F5E62
YKATLFRRSKGSIYYHFKNIEGLFLYLMEQSQQDWIDDWARKSQQYTTSSEKLYGLAEHFADDFQNPLMKAGEEFVGSQAADAEVLQELLRLMRLPYQIYETILAEGMANGEFKQESVEDVKYILMGLLGGLGNTQYEMDFARMRELYRKAISIFLHGISSRGTG